MCAVGVIGTSSLADGERGSISRGPRIQHYACVSRDEHHRGLVRSLTGNYRADRDGVFDESFQGHRPVGIFCGNLQYLLVRACLAMGTEERKEVAMCMRVCWKETALP